MHRPDRPVFLAIAGLASALVGALAGCGAEVAGTSAAVAAAQAAQASQARAQQARIVEGVKQGQDAAPARAASAADDIEK